MGGKKKKKERFPARWMNGLLVFLLMLVSVSIFVPVINVSSVDSAEKCGCNPTSPSPVDNASSFRRDEAVSSSTRGDFLPSGSSKLFSVFRIWGDKVEKTHNESQRTRGHLCHLEVLQKGLSDGKLSGHVSPRKQSLLSHLCLELEIRWLARQWWGSRVQNRESAAFRRIISQANTVCEPLPARPPRYTVQIHDDSSEDKPAPEQQRVVCDLLSLV